MALHGEVLVRLTRLLDELRHDQRAMRARAQETEDLASQCAKSGTISRSDLILIAVNLHGWYTAAETGFERIARLFDGSVPSGSTWDTDLLAQMQLEIPGLRPPVIAKDRAAALHELRKFRHFFRNAYVLEIDPDKVIARTKDLSAVASDVDADLEAFVAHIESVLANA